MGGGRGHPTLQLRSLSVPLSAEKRWGQCVSRPESSATAGRAWVPHCARSVQLAAAALPGDREVSLMLGSPPAPSTVCWPLRQHPLDSKLPRSPTGLETREEPASGGQRSQWALLACRGFQWEGGSGARPHAWTQAGSTDGFPHIHQASPVSGTQRGWGTLVSGRSGACSWGACCPVMAGGDRLWWRSPLLAHRVPWLSRLWEEKEEALSEVGWCEGQTC